MKREKSAQNFFLPYREFGIDIFKDKKNHSTRNAFLNKRVKTPYTHLRPMSSAKNESLFVVDKKLKKMTLSNKSFFNYMNKYTKLTQNFTFKIPDIFNYPRKKNPKYLSILYLQKFGYKDVDNENKKIFNDNTKSNSYNTIDFNGFEKISNISNINSKKEKEKENEKKENVIKKKPYGFKYGDTRIVLDKNKMRVKSSLFRSSNSGINITNINMNQNFKNRTNFNFYISKEEKKRNKIFNYFYEGDFLQNGNQMNQRPQSKYQTLEAKKIADKIIINDYDVNNNIQILFDMIKDIKKKNRNNVVTSKSMNYNIKNYFKKEDFTFHIDIESICLKFINQEDVNKSKYSNENNEKKSQKLFLPFEYLPLFYLLDYTSFKVFLSEIIYYNKETNLMEINQEEVLQMLNKYKKFITLNIINQDANKKRAMEKITYNCKEHHYQTIYDWIIYLKTEEENHLEIEESKYEAENNEDNDDKTIKFNYDKNIIYKLKIILPMIKFQIINRNIYIKKYLNKNLLINILKNNFEKWEEKVLCELFMNKKFRNIMNSTISSNSGDSYEYNYSLATRKIFIDKVENKEKLINKSKYEFFITNANKEFSHYLYYSPYSILVLFGKEKEKKFFSKISVNIKESINLYKYSQYWGYMNTLNKCLTINKNNQKIFLNLQILEENPEKFINLQKNENGGGVLGNENIKDLDTEGIIKYNNNYDLEMYLLNCSIVEIQITQFKMDKRFYKVPKDLLDIFLSDNIKDEQNLNMYINDFCDYILFNDEIYNLKREEMELRRKALNNDGSVQFVEDFSSEKHKTVFSFKTLNKLNSFRISPLNRYSSGLSFCSGESNRLKRSETKEMMNMNGLGFSFKSVEHLNKSQSVNRKFEKKYTTVFHKKRASKIHHKNSDLKKFVERTPVKNNTNVMKNENKDIDKIKDD